MIINLKKIHYYYLSNNNDQRKNHIIEELKDYNLTQVNYDPNYINSRYQSGASGFNNMLELGKNLQDESKNFEPFVILEDDIKKNKEFPEFIDIPDNTDIFYIGLSKCGIYNQGVFNIVKYSNINVDIIRIYNMLSSHGLIICSYYGLSIIQNCMLNAIKYNLPWDIEIAILQNKFNVYAFRIPLIYQYEKLGGNEIATKIEYNELLDYPLDLIINYMWIK